MDKNQYCILLFFIFYLKKKNLGEGGYLIPGPGQTIGLQEDLHYTYRSLIKGGLLAAGLEPRPFRQSVRALLTKPTPIS